MTFTLEKLVADVMARLGEVRLPQPPEGGDQEVPQPPEGGYILWPEDIIRLKVKSLLSDVGSRLLLEAESYLLNSPPLGGRGVCRFVLMPCGFYAVEVRLPEDFLLLVSVKMSGWVRSVNTLVKPESPEWHCQWSVESGIAGSPERPRAYLDRDSGGLLLRLVGSKTADANLEHLSILRIPALSDEATFDFPATLYSSLVSGMVASIATQ